MQGSLFTTLFGAQKERKLVIKINQQKAQTGRSLPPLLCRDSDPLEGGAGEAKGAQQVVERFELSPKMVSYFSITVPYEHYSC